MQHFGLKPEFSGIYYKEWAKAAFLLWGFGIDLSTLILGSIPFPQLPTALAVGNKDFVNTIGFSQTIDP